MSRPFEVMGVDEIRDWFPVELKNRFAYRPERGYAWLQRACIWILRKLGCNAVGEELKVTRQLIRQDNVADALMQQSEVARHIFRDPDRIHRVLMGPDQYQEIMKELWSAGYLTFRGNATGGINGRPVVFGLEVTVVPWMHGLLVMPDES